MKLLHTILISSFLSVILFASDKTVINYDKKNGFIYYSDGSVYMINKELEIAETTPLITNDEELEIVESIPLSQPVATYDAKVEQHVSLTPKLDKIDKNHLTKIGNSRQNGGVHLISSKKTKSKDGKFVGNIKLIHVIDGKDNGYDTTTGSTYYVNGGYETAEVNGFSAKVTGYVVGDTGLTETDKSAKIANGQFMGEKTNDKTTILKTKANIEEAYIKYKNPKFKAQVGHMKLNTPMTKNTISTVPNLYEGAIVSSKALLDNTIVVGAHITKMAYGARAISDWSRIAEKTTTGGAVKVYSVDQEKEIETLAGDEALPGKIRRGKFVNFGKISDIDDTVGMTIVGAINKSIKNTSVQAWEYFIYDVANITYVDGMTKFRLKNGVKTMVGAQIMHENIKEKGGNPMLFGVKGAASYKGAQLIIAINKSNGDAILNVWGGDPAYTSMVHSKNAYRPDVTAIKLVGKYKLSNLSATLPKNLSLTVAHGNFSKSSLKNAQKDATETDIALKYKPKKNILFKLVNVQRETEFDGFKGKDKTQNMTKFVVKYRF